MKPVVEDIKSFIETKDWESAMAAYAVFCGKAEVDEVQASQHELSVFVRQPEITRLLLEAKSRYRECFLAFLPSNDRCFLQQAFGEEAPFMDEVLSTLALSSERAQQVSLFYDRICEWKLLCNSDKVPFLTKSMLLEEIQKRGVNNDSVLFQTIAETAPLYFLRRLQILDVAAFARLEAVLPPLTQNKGHLRIYEYGCGAADIGLYFARTGHGVTVCDAEKGMLPLVKKRFQLRGLEAEYLGASAENPIPAPSGGFDLVIAIEVLEYVRHPIELLRMLDACVTQDGVIMLGSFPFNETQAVGDHLKETVERRTELLSWIKRHWSPIKVAGAGNSFRRKRRFFSLFFGRSSAR